MLIIYNYNKHHVITAQTTPLHLLMISVNMRAGELSVNYWENKVTCITYLKNSGILL